MEYVKYTENKYNYKIIGLFKKDFYKYFLDIKDLKTKSLSSPKKSKSIRRNSIGGFRNIFKNTY